jgi:hypothetical protein
MHRQKGSKHYKAGWTARVRERFITTLLIGSLVDDTLDREYNIVIEQGKYTKGGSNSILGMDVENHRVYSICLLSKILNRPQMKL